MKISRLAGRQSERLGQLTQRAEVEGHAIQKHQMLHLHAHGLQSIHNQFGFPILHDGPIQNEMKIKRLGMMCYSEDFIGPGSWFD